MPVPIPCASVRRREQVPIEALMERNETRAAFCRGPDGAVERKVRGAERVDCAVGFGVGGR